MFNDNYSKVVSRNYTSQNQVQDAGLPSSGQDLGYRTKSSGVIGRLIPVSYQHLMPGSKFSGKSVVAPTLDQMSTPIAPDMLLRIHNFSVPYFAVNKDFRDIMTTNPGNDFNKDFTIGYFDPLVIFKKVMLLFPSLSASLIAASNSSATVAQLKTGIFIESNYSLSSIVPSSSWMNNYKDIYVDGAFQDLKNQVASRMVSYSSLTTAALIRENLYSIAQPIIDFFFGEHSLFDNLGYSYVSHDQLSNLCLKGLSSSSTVVWDRILAYLMFSSPVQLNPPSLYFNDTALRCYQAVWIDFYRNVQIQKKVGDVLDYHKWDNQMSLNNNPNQAPSAWQMQLLITRICPWNEDLFTSAQLDDIMRHIYMPITESLDGVVAFGPSSTSENSSVIPGARWITSQQLSYQDSNGVSRSVILPIPTLLNRALNNITDTDPTADTFGFDLFSMKRAQMLERFLKRGHYFGNDEYRDIIKGRYGVDVSDLRLNRPHFLGGATSMMQLDQHISSAGETGIVGSGSFGQRVVTGNGHLEGNTFTDFSEEWAMTLSLFSIIPDVQYDPLCIQNTQIFPQDFPDPILCENFEAIIPTQALARNYYFSSGQSFGHAPSAYQYRQRVNEVHGRFLDEFSGYTAARFFGNSDETTPRLNSLFLECRPYLGFFVNTILLDGQFWFVNDNEFYVENPLPAPVEVI